jgi:hypothetical protein
MTALSGGRKHGKIEKVTAAQDDGFVGGLEYNWFNMSG